ncbi:MAG TPA: putative lipid II flippase FtsW [Anaerovoracaceae bacterium]|nr:putative lipid II flippase FtsW [Anaerovoracaceae bacterium]
MNNNLLSKKGEFDFIIMLLVLGFVVFGIVMVFSASYYSTMNVGDGDPYYYLRKQCTFAAIGLVGMLACMHIDYHIYGRFQIPILFGSLILLILVFTDFGVTVNSATRWIEIGHTRITPSEFAKLAAILFTSSYIYNKPNKIREFRGMLPLFLIMIFYALLIIVQPNLSTAIVVCALIIGIMFVAGMNSGYLLILTGILSAGITYILMFKQDTHWYFRLTNWVDPFENRLGEGYQVSQSLIALGNGGIFGRGLGNSVTKYLYLPEPQNDFIMAIIGEELGFTGIIIIMMLYIILIYKGFKVALKASDKLGMLIASGITMMLAFQVIINVAVVTASMPATGITLPFISYGGTSLIIFMISMGILLNISKKSGGKK